MSDSDRGTIGELVGGIALFVLGSGFAYLYVKAGEWWVEGISTFLRDHIALR